MLTSLIQQAYTNDQATTGLLGNGNQKNGIGRRNTS